MKAGPLARGVLLVALAATALVGASGLASADHTGVLQLNDRAGPYVLMAWTQPKRPRTDACQLTVTVMRSGNFRPVPDAVVRVSAERAGATGAMVPITADRGPDPGAVSHVADLRLPSPGRWTVTVHVSGPEGSGTADFPLEVEAASWGVGAAMVGAGAALLGSAAAWLLWRTRSRNARLTTDRAGRTAS
jgi:hypothetical protein